MNTVIAAPLPYVYLLSYCVHYQSSIVYAAPGNLSDVKTVLLSEGKLVVLWKKLARLSSTIVLYLLLYYLTKCSLHY